MKADRASGEVKRTSVRKKTIPPWLIWGGLIGLIQIFSMATVAPLGVSTAYPQVLGWLVDKIVPWFAESQPYIQRIGGKLGWKEMLVLGMVLGAGLSRLLQARSGNAGKGCGVVSVPSQTPWVRGLMAFVGGFLILFGARLADGCTSGHMLSGIAQLALSGFVFGMSVFASGVLIATLMMRKRSV